MRRRIMFAPTILLAAALLASCAGSSETEQSPATAESSSSTGSADDASQSADSQEFPDVIDAVLSANGDEFTVAVTISSPYDSAERYADGWRVLTTDGDVLAEHQLGHDHANEQPFTRTSSAFAIPDDVMEVIVEGRDQEYGYGGATVTVEVPR
ncbi:hypothetical protein [Corynebacterium alimapuense]|uniref:Uncharacterized protein n=1 Tax=Corynebacterium alimapuense TaxID=1576874 RepID=A0A3M8K7P3_9CORY|nr:hypothetical protein [Corynebacterium alimapuense]RNE48498.1 hypothetical protein C5L39_08345 [Corynebacterium alimapuense]